MPDMKTLTRTNRKQNGAHVAIACGGTGGHLFPGLAVADQLAQNGCSVTLLISPKEVDQLAVRSASGMDIITLPAIGLKRGGKIAFARGFAQRFGHRKTPGRERAKAIGQLFSGARYLASARSINALS